jgi:hypothetical protein
VFTLMCNPTLKACPGLYCDSCTLLVGMKLTKDVLGNINERTSIKCFHLHTETSRKCKLLSDCMEWSPSTKVKSHEICDNSPTFDETLISITLHPRA